MIGQPGDLGGRLPVQARMRSAPIIVGPENRNREFVILQLLLWPSVNLANRLFCVRIVKFERSIIDVERSLGRPLPDVEADKQLGF